MSDSFASEPTFPSLAAGRAWFERKRRGLMLAILVLMFIVAALAPRIFVTIPAGQGGVLWLRFFGGTQVNRPALTEGLHVIFPWDNIFVYDMRVQEHDELYEVVVKEGLHLSVRCSVRWQLNHLTLAKLHKKFGPNYLNVLLIPEIGSVLRERISQYELEELFTSRRAQIQREIMKSVVMEAPEKATNRIGHAQHSERGEDFVTLADVLLKDVVLPPRLRSAIERKLEQAQISLEYTFRIQREQLESERKQIEAQGIQAFQQTVQAGISDAYLKWRGIEATLQLATSPNAKVVIVGGGSQGLPLILNTGDVGGPQPGVVAPTQPAHPVGTHPTSGAAGTWPTEQEGTQLSGSIDAKPPKGNTSLEYLGTPDAAEDTGEPVAPGPTAASDGSEAPPQILRSFAGAFGYRLQPDTSATSPEAGAAGAR